MLTMSLKERDRLVVLRQVSEGFVTVSEGAARLGLSPRHLRRVLRRFEREGDIAVIHRARGRPPNNRKSEAVRRRALERAQEPHFHDFGPTLLAEHLSRDPEIGSLSAHTLRRWLVEAGLWSRRRRHARHRRRRERRAAAGELVQMDTSVHPWLEDRSTEEIVLIALLDDATSRLFARFFPRDTGAANRQMLIDYLQRYGRMGALYTDRASHFQGHWQASARQARDEEQMLTVLRRALEALEIELILALSPQAKGRIERLFGTLQDRLLKEMRVRGIDSLGAANHFLEAEFLPFWNERFVVEPADPTDAHRPLPEGADLHSLFADLEERLIRNDFTFRYRNRHFQIEKAQADLPMPGSRLVIERRLDGTTRFRWRGRYLNPTPLDAAPKVPPPEPGPRKPPPTRPIPPDHPWRRFPIRVGRGRYAPTLTASPAVPHPSTNHSPPGE
jgi:hypothetical protein